MFDAIPIGAKATFSSHEDQHYNVCKVLEYALNSDNGKSCIIFCRKEKEKEKEEQKCIGYLVSLSDNGVWKTKPEKINTLPITSLNLCRK